MDAPTDKVICDAVVARLTDIAPDLMLFAPTATRDFWVVCTLGASLRDMAVPDVPDAALWRRGGCLVARPADGPGLDRDKGVVNADTDFHPMTLRKRVARDPHAQYVMVGAASTLQFPAPLGPDTGMRSVLIWWPDFAKADAEAGVDIGEMSVNFYQVTPIHEAERASAAAGRAVDLQAGLAAAGAMGVCDITRAPIAEAAA